VAIRLVSSRYWINTNVTEQFIFISVDVSIDMQIKPLEVGGHIVDSVLIFGDNDGKVSVLDTFGRQLCSGTLPQQAGHEVNIPRKFTFATSKKVVT